MLSSVRTKSLHSEGDGGSSSLHRCCILPTHLRQNVRRSGFRRSGVEGWFWRIFDLQLDSFRRLSPGHLPHKAERKIDPRRYPAAGDDVSIPCYPF